MSSRLRDLSRLDLVPGPGGRIGRLLLLAVVCASLTVACSPRETEPDARATQEDGKASQVSLAALEGLTFVRGGAIWTISNGEPIRIIDSEGARSLRGNRSGDSVTWIEPDGTRAIVMTALSSDWRPERLWESDLGSLLTEAAHDDITDTVWFSVSGEPTTTIGAVELLTRQAPRAVLLPVDVAPFLAVDPAGGALFLVSAAQEPTTLYRPGPPPIPLVEAARLFSPQVSPDGRTIVATGSLRPEDTIGLLLVDVEQGSTKSLPAGRGVPTDPVWARAGDVIAFRDAATQTIWTVGVNDSAAQDTGVRADEGGLAW